MGTFRLPEPDPNNPGMTLERYEEIAESEKNGSPLDVTPQERKEYESFKQTLSDFRETVIKATRFPSFRLPGITESDKLQSKLTASLNQQRHQLRSAEPTVNLHETAIESIREANEAKAEAEAQRVQREITQTEALKELVAQAQGQSRVNRWVVGIGAATLLVSAAAAILSAIALGASQPSEVRPTSQNVTEAP